MTSARQAFGIEVARPRLGGGLLPGTLTVVAGATGVGKTQLGLALGRCRLERRRTPGRVCDLTSRGDSQNHGDYAARLFGWDLSEYPPDAEPGF